MLSENQIRLINLIEMHKSEVKDIKYRIAELENNIRQSERHIQEYRDEYDSIY